MEKRFNKGFTLAEVMIVLTVIGVLAGILIPVANNARPDEKVMKFKKAHATLMNVIHELVTSDKYFADGDLGIRTDGTLLDGTHNGDKSYLCSAFVDIVSAKSNNCNDAENYPNSKPRHYLTDYQVNLEEMSERIANICEEGSEWYTCSVSLTTVDNIKYTLLGACEPYGVGFLSSQADDVTDLLAHCGSSITNSCRIYKVTSTSDTGNMLCRYKGLCIDINGEKFSYGLRVDGKILLSPKVKEWLEKDFQKGKNDN